MEYLELKNIENTDYFYQEAIKTLRTNLQFCGSSVRVIMFTSTMPSEGKSSTAFAAAVSLSDIRKKVLFIDADIRKSMMVKTHEISGHNAGLSQYLSGQKTLEEVVYGTNVENLDLVLAGPYSPNPAELLEDPTFKTLIEWGRERYDYIIIDTPPMMNLIDAAIIAEEADGAVLVVESGNISYRIAQRVKDQLEKSGCKILGAVLNRAGTGNSGGYYKKYYGKYYKKYDKYYEDRSERVNDDVRKASSALESAMTAEPKKVEKREPVISEPVPEKISVIPQERERESSSETDSNGRKAGCSRKRKDRN